MNNMAKTPTFGKYNTPITTIRHSATASWSGFVYQGLCALHYALVLLHTDWNNAKTKKLNLEGYEDFSILDCTDLIVSLHQCKCNNAPKNFTDECQKMSDKQEYWDNQKKLSPAYSGLYFHTNQKNTYVCGISSYNYNTTDGLCSPTKISELIVDELNKILKDRTIVGSSVSKNNRLIEIIIKHVEKLHNEQITTGKDMFDIACNESISFSTLIDAIEKDSDDFSMQEKARTCRHYFVLEMNCRLLTSKVNGTKVVDFMNKLDTLDEFSLIQFVRRIFPDEDILNSSVDNISIRSKERADCLFNVINKIDDPIDDTNFDWTRDCDNIKQSPSTLGSNKEPEEFCPDIIQNHYSNDIRRDYRWIIGDVKYKVDDIDEAAKQITQIQDMDYSNITNPRQIGLLDIKSKNDGNY